MLFDDELSGCTTIDSVEIGLVELECFCNSIRKRWPGCRFVVLDFLGLACVLNDVVVETVPGGFGDTFVAVDLSGSMDHPLSANSTLRLKEIGALFGAILDDQGAEVGGFGDDFQTVPMQVDTPVLQRQAAVLAIDEDVGNSTNGWKAIKHLHDREAFESSLAHSEYSCRTSDP